MENIIINIFTIGFHHKRGCEIEFIFPSFNDEILKKNQFEIWKNLPSLALPDGAHKRNSDIINFVLPGVINSNHKLLFGVSCFKQISADSVKTKTDDITRNSIQKSVVVLSILPLYGAISSFLKGITENYFENGNFEDRTILTESFYQLNDHFRLILEDNTLRPNGLRNLINQDLSVINLISQYEHGLLNLIKMIFLRKKVLFFMEPIDKLTTTILSLISLFQGVLETKSFQKSSDLLEETIITNTSTPMQSEILAKDTDCHEEDQEISFPTVSKSNSNDSIPPGGKSLLQNLKSGGGQTLKVLSSLTSSGANAIWWGNRNSPSPELENRLNASENLAVPLPPFLTSDGYVDNNGKSDYDMSKGNWGFPLDIFDQNNILLPYASIGQLNILENTQINSFMVGANNHLWKMKYTKYDLIINEDIKSGGMELCQVNNQNKQDDFYLGKLLQLTVLDRRFIDYLLQVVKSHFKNIITKTDIIQSQSCSDLIVEIGEDPTLSKTEEAIIIHKFSDSKELEEWLRVVLLDYIKAVLLNAAALGTKTSFENFGWNFLQSVQQQSYFERWYNSVERTSIITESSSNLSKLLPSESMLLLNIPSQITGDNSETEIAGKSHSIMNYDHPGRFIHPKIGDNIPGYYQFREYADHSKALVNKSVNEIKKFSSDKGGQLKSTVSAGLSKLSDIAKIRGIKLGSTWWQTDSKPEDKVVSESVTKD